MKELEVVKVSEAELKNPVMIEGLPGVGHIGKLIADHLIEEIDVKKITEIYSCHFPPQVMVQPDGTIRLTRNEVYASEQHDLLIITGDHQSTTPEGHYLITEQLLDMAESYNVSRIYTLGGYGIGSFVDEPYVICATNDKHLVDEMRQYDVEFRDDEPGGGIVGATGLLLGLGKRKGIDAVCMMGVTSGYMVDPKSAKTVLDVLSKVINIKVSTKVLIERGKEMEKFVEKLKGAQERETKGYKGEEWTGYIR